MKQFNLQKGSRGEEEAARYLGQKGYQILERNHRTKFGELDIIASDKETLVFVEVKTKIGEDFGSPEEMINSKKLRQVKRTAQMYLLANEALRQKHKQQRIDAVAIVLRENGSPERVSHYENIGA